jgi:hypothetical protein
MKKLTIITMLIATVGISSCKKGFLDESINPNSPSVATPALLLTSAEKGAADIVNGWGSYTATNYMYAHYAVWGGYWLENPSGYITDGSLTQYNFTTGTSGFAWSDLYDNLSNVNILEQNSTSGADANPNYEAIAKVLKAYGFEQLVDNYNDVAYSQAFQKGNLTPAYDSGASVYADLIKQLDAAITLINANTSAATPAADDIIFGGNMISWKKFANTLKLRLIMRQSNLSGFAALKSELTTTAAEGYLDGTTQATAQPGFGLSDAFGGQENPFYLNYGIRPSGTTTLYGNSYWLANAFCVNLMKSLNDTARIKEFYATVDGSNDPNQVVGAVLGSTTIPKAVSKIGPGLIGDVTTSAGQVAGASKPAVLFSGAESLFLQAEAAMDGMIAGTPSALYQAGITASFESLGLSDLEASTYYRQPSVSAVTQQSIITQKYISLNGYGVFEAYNEYRRTGYPAITKSLNSGALGAAGQLPARIFYPQVEYNTNPAAVAKEPAATVATEFNSKIFWAK